MRKGAGLAVKLRAACPAPNPGSRPARAARTAVQPAPMAGGGTSRQAGWTGLVPVRAEEPLRRRGRG